MKTHIYFIIRYSAYTRTQGLWQIGKGVSSEDYKAKLFSEDRLQLHEKLFFSVTLPSLEAISKSVEMTALVFISDELPEPYKKSLRKAEENYEWMEVARAKSHKALNQQVEQQVQKKLGRANEEMCFATVRLDDDDALAPDFGVKLARYLKPEFVGMGVTFPKGVFGVFDGERYTAFYHYSKPNNAQGLAFIGSTNSSLNQELPVTVLSAGSHVSLDERYPTVNDSRDIMFIRTEHEGSDLIATGRVREKDKMKSLSEDELSSLKTRFSSIQCF